MTLCVSTSVGVRRHGQGDFQTVHIVTVFFILRSIPLEITSSTSHTRTHATCSTLCRSDDTVEVANHVACREIPTDVVECSRHPEEHSLVLWAPCTHHASSQTHPPTHTSYLHPHLLNMDTQKDKDTWRIWPHTRIDTHTHTCMHLYRFTQVNV